MASVAASGFRSSVGVRSPPVRLPIASGNHFYVVEDKLRSVRGLVKRDGTWVLSQRFGPYGAVVARDTSASGPGFALRYGWTGREYDAETGWYYF